MALATDLVGRVRRVVEGYRDAFADSAHLAAGPLPAGPKVRLDARRSRVFTSTRVSIGKQPRMPPFPPAARTVWVTLGLGALAVVAVSMLLGRLVDAAPCHLCIAQRALLLLVAPTALVAALAWRNLVGPLAGAATAAVAATGVVVAARQSWLERQPPEVAAGCAGLFAPTPTERAAAWLGDAVPWLFRVEGACDAIGPTLLGLTFANAGLATFAVVAGAAALTLVRWRPGAGRRAPRQPSEEVPRAEQS